MTSDDTLALVGVVLGLLTVVTVAGQLLKRQTDDTINRAALSAFNQRIRAWWMMCCLLAAAFWFPEEVAVTMFGLISFWALREFITLTPTRLGDHRALSWVFFGFTPLQYILVGVDELNFSLPGGRVVTRPAYDLYSILIPVYAFLFIPARVAFSGDSKRFLERVAKIQSGLLICVYCLSYAAALLYLDLVDSEGNPYNYNARLLFFFIVMVQLADVLTFAWDRLFGRHVIAERINSSRTWEGLLGGAGCTTLIGSMLAWSTPFSAWQASCMSLMIAILAAGGSMTMSAIKRDRGVKDYGTLVTGHGGVLDRIDSICFAAPVFYHVTRYFFAIV